MLNLVLFLIFLLLLALGAPIAFALLGASSIYVIVKEVPLALMGHVMANAVDSFILIALPLFVLAAKLMEEALITDRIMEFSNDAVGWVPGGLGHVNVFASMIFAGMSGSAVADAGGLGNMELAMMKKAGYDDDFSVAVTASSATIGPILPPSLFFILYGAICQVSVGKLFLAGAVPGVLLGLAIMVRVFIHALKHDYPRRPFPKAKQFLRSARRAFLPCLTPIIIIGGIASGVFTPTEAAAVACLYAVVLGKIVYRTLTWDAFYRAVVYSVYMTAVVVFIIAVAGLFSWILTSEGLTSGFSEFMLALTGDKWAAIGIFILLFLVLGMFVEEAAIMIMTLPIIYPLLEIYGIDPVHFGVVTTLALMIAMLTPPFGLLLFVLSAITGRPVMWVFKASYSYILPIFATLLLIAFVPQITLWLPNLLMGR